jgi:hypothetical protein
MDKMPKCFGCGDFCKAAYFFVKVKGAPIRYYCEKCAKERGHGTGKRD